MRKNVSNSSMKTVKFMQTLLASHWNRLKVLAEERGITVQDYIRIFLVSEYLKHEDSLYSNRAKKAWKTRRMKQKRIADVSGAETGGYPQ